jgi:hypothetical protein
MIHAGTAGVNIEKTPPTKIKHRRSGRKLKLEVQPANLWESSTD